MKPIPVSVWNRASAHWQLETNTGIIMAIRIRVN
jgi:hypothetical protein